MIEAFVTNLGRYNEEHLDGEPLKLPASTEEVQALLRRIHVDGVRYEEVFITNYESGIPGLCQHLDEYDNLDELNYLAALLDGMEKWEVEQFAAAVEFDEYTDSVNSLINLAQNLDCYELYLGIEGAEDLGRYYIEELCALEVPEHLQNYIDYAAYGRDMYHGEDGRFVDGGYIVRSSDSLTEYYHDREDIPEEYRVFAYPEQSTIRDTIKQHQQMLENVAPPQARPAPALDER